MGKITASERVHSKIKSLKGLKKALAAQRRKGRRIAHCHGVFDLLHPGHVVHLKDARRHGDVLAVTVTPDRFVNKGPGRPMFGEQLRLSTLASLEYVDYVALNEWPAATDTIRLLRPDVYVKGGDYAEAQKDHTGKIVEERDAVESVGGKLVFTEGFTSSSSLLINRFFSAYPEKTQEYLKNFRSKWTADEIITRLQGLADVKVLVVGEAILDHYTYCEALGKSPKEMIVAMRHVSEERFAGGAVATANHIAALCRRVTLLTGLGPDAGDEKFLRAKLRPNVKMQVVRTPDRPTVRKRRFVEPNSMRKVFEVQYIDDAPMSGKSEEEFVRELKSLVKKHDLVVVNDFGHGLMTERMRRAASSCGKFLALNTQSNSANHGYNPVTHYRRADFVSLDKLELHVAARRKYGPLSPMIREIQKRLKAGTFLVSLGSEGTLISSGGKRCETPALAIRVLDRVGAGDALFAAASPCAYRGMPAELLGFIGNCVGALAVEIVCNREPIDSVRLFKFIETVLK